MNLTYFQNSPTSFFHSAVAPDGTVVATQRNDEAFADFVSRARDLVGG
ncbi:hypothetical protein [Coralloluteibacterium stylophorae]|uniref:Uncharacterized protein n=1 Tax=Coralloluteibacterium stylophorae TaxID=1776034 RepID=A0A8J7VSX1_9GAMM|nr:hypothetical protein [Coralloluteibacterium stylophorae]MBS7457669.1 hypothetical protein [Coralloluteibacterium stylophorae]